MRSPIRSSRAQRKIKSLRALSRIVRQAQSRGRAVVFTNGCFDLLHPGHVKLLEHARHFGDLLVVALNSDRSVRALKGPHRPILKQADRALLLAALETVDYVILFDQLTPEHLIAQLRPQILIKGADWTARQIIGREIVRRSGGRVVRLPLVKGYSSTQLIKRIQVRA